MLIIPLTVIPAVLCMYTRIFYFKVSNGVRKRRCTDTSLHPRACQCDFCSGLNPQRVHPSTKMKHLPTAQPVQLCENFGNISFSVKEGKCAFLTANNLGCVFLIVTSRVFFYTLLVLRVKHKMCVLVFLALKTKSNKIFSSLASDEMIIHPHSVVSICRIIYIPSTFWWMSDESLTQWCIWVIH